MTKMTPWFRGSVKPARQGVYLRDHDSWGECFSKWDGRHWLFPARSVEVADNESRVSDIQKCPWRGLATDLSPAGRT